MSARAAAPLLLLVQIVCVLLGYLVVETDASTLRRGLLVVPALLWAPGLGWASWLAIRKGEPLFSLGVALRAVWISIAIAVAGIFALRELALEPRLLFLFSALLALPGSFLALRGGRFALPPGPPSPRLLLGVLLLVLGLARFAGWGEPMLARTMGSFWWDARGEEPFGEPGIRIVPGFERVGDPDSSAFEREVLAGVTPLGSWEPASALLLLCGDVGLVATLRSADGEAVTGRIERDLVVEEREPDEQEWVPRYLDRGVLTLSPPGSGALEIEVDRGAQLYLLGQNESIWALQEQSRLWYVHPYQILNLVENQRWAAGTWTDTRLTINQPPLWAYVLSVSTAFISADLNGASWLFLWVLFFGGLSGLRLLQVLSPKAHALSWTLPALATLVHGRLMLEPGSVNFPDNLYAVAILAGAAELLSGSARGYGVLTPVASLLRYPGAGVLLVMGLLQEPVAHWAKSRLLRASFIGAGALVMLGLGVAMSGGLLSDWAGIVYFEFSPEHWHGDFRPGALLSRAPEFYWTWFRYAGFTPILALATARGRSLRLLLAAFAYSLLLCTIDHFPSHYFLPLIHLSAIALAAGANLPQSALIRHGALLLGILGLCASLAMGT